MTPRAAGLSAMLLLSLGLEGCASLVVPLPPDVEPGWVEAPEDSIGWVVGTSPGDLSTSLGTLLNATVTIDLGVPEDLAWQIAEERVRIVTWPEGVEVESSFRQTASTFGGRVFEFRPDELEDRWYALEVADVSDVGIIRGGSVGLDGGGRATRYRPGPDAVLQHVQAVGTDAGLDLRVKFSRVLTDSRAPEALITVEPDTPCTVASGGNGASFIELTCGAPGQSILYVGTAADIETIGGTVVHGSGSPTPRRLAVPVPDQGRRFIVRPPYRAQR